MKPSPGSTVDEMVGDQMLTLDVETRDTDPAIKDKGTGLDATVRGIGLVATNEVTELRRATVGKVPLAPHHCKMGTKKICRFYNTPRGCNKTVVNNCCKMGENVYHHLCAMVTAVHGSEITLCGKNHTAMKHV